MSAATIDADHGSHAGAGHDGGHGHGDELAHVMPIPMLLGVFAALVGLTFLTTAVARPDVAAFTGRAEVWIALAIAFLKATLVATFFMHLKYDKPLNALLLVFSLVFMALFLTLSVADAGAYRAQLETKVKLELPAEEVAPTAESEPAPEEAPAE